MNKPKQEKSLKKKDKAMLLMTATRARYFGKKSDNN